VVVRAVINAAQEHSPFFMTNESSYSESVTAPFLP
jgi:hypothetical protein